MADRIDEVLIAPVASMISEVGRSVAEASQALSAAQAEMIQKWPEALVKAGVMPTFFHMQDVQVELKMTLQIEEDRTAQSKFRFFGTPVNAKARVVGRTVSEGTSQLKMTFAPGPVPMAIDPASEG